MTAAEAGLDSLRLTLSRASKSLVASSAFFLSAALISFGASPEAVKAPGLIFTVPAHMARLIFIFCGAGSIWLSWAWIRQALSLLHRLEFQHEIDPEHIRDALVGSSLISASPVMMKGLSYLCVLLVLFALAPPYVDWTFVHGLIGLLLGGPYLLLIIDQRLRFLNPNNWSKVPFGLAFAWKIDPAMAYYKQQVVAEEFNRLTRRLDAPIRVTLSATIMGALNGTLAFIGPILIDRILAELPSEFTEDEFKERISTIERDPENPKEYHRSLLVGILEHSGLVEIIEQQNNVRHFQKNHNRADKRIKLP